MQRILAMVGLGALLCAPAAQAHIYMGTDATIPVHIQPWGCDKAPRHSLPPCVVSDNPEPSVKGMSAGTPIAPAGASPVAAIHHTGQRSK